MAGLELTFALGKYDRHVPFFMGMVTPPDGIASLNALNVGMTGPGRDGMQRHGRMLRDREFDVAEVSLSSYIVAKATGQADGLTATPVFPRRLFSQNQLFVSRDSPIATPRDLVGRRIGVYTFQTSLSVLAKGDLKLEYGVPWEQIVWITERREEIATATKPGVRIEPAEGGQSIGEMLVRGELDAIFVPNPPIAVLTRPDRVRRLFTDPRAECLRYFKKYGFYPIMHVMAIKAELAKRAPFVPRAVIGMWEQAKLLAISFNRDPAYSHAVFTHQELEDQDRVLAGDVWPSGLAANRASLEHFVGYVADQGLIANRVSVDSLFHETVLDT